jgi:hypothetical protein
MTEPLTLEQLERLAAGRRIFGNEPQFATTPCAGDVFLYRGVGPQPKPSRLAAALDYFRPMSLLVDFSRAGLDVPDTIPRRLYLYKGLAPEILDEVSPQFLPPSKRVDRFDLLERGWGADSVVAVFSELDPTALLLRLRHAATFRGEIPPAEETPPDRPKPQEAEEEGPPPDAPKFLCIGMPSVLISLLANGEATTVRRLMDGLDAVLCEGEGGSGWVVCSGGRMKGVLEQLGFREV